MNTSEAVLGAATVGPTEDLKSSMVSEVELDNQLVGRAAEVSHSHLPMLIFNNTVL